jgi:hypothetical protein
VTISFRGIDPYPADGGSDTGATNALDKDTGVLASAVAGDLIVVVVHQRSTSSLRWPYMSVSGGQQWQSVRVPQATNIRLGVFYCRFNGTWTADPVFGHSDGTGTTTLSTHALVFAPTVATNQWQVNIGPRTSTFNATGTTKTLTAHTTTQASTVTLAIWATVGTITWGSLSGTGWTQSGLSAQYGNLGGSDHVTAMAYNIQTSAGALSNVSLTQSAGTAGVGMMISFYEFSGYAVGTQAGTAEYQASSINQDVSSASATCSLPSGSVAGQGIWGYCSYETAVDCYPTGISDGTNTYQIVHRYCHQYFDQEAIVFFCPELTGSPSTVTVSFSSNVAYWTVALARISSMGTFLAGRGRDQYAQDAFNPEVFQTELFTPAEDNCLIIGALHTPGDTMSSNFYTWTTPSTERVENHAMTSFGLATQAQTTAAATRVNVSMTLGRNVMGFCGAWTSAVSPVTNRARLIGPSLVRSPLIYGTLTQ